MQWTRVVTASFESTDLLCTYELYSVHSVPNAICNVHTFNSMAMSQVMRFGSPVQDEWWWSITCSAHALPWCNLAACFQGCIDVQNPASQLYCNCMCALVRCPLDASCLQTLAPETCSSMQGYDHLSTCFAGSISKTHNRWPPSKVVLKHVLLLYWSNDSFLVSTTLFNENLNNTS